MSEGLVVQLSRRNALVLLPNHIRHKMRVGSKIQALTVGDRVSWREEQGSYFIQEVLPRKNSLSRSYRKRTKEIAANVDLICIITAMQPLFNTHFVDRCLVSAVLEKIPVLLVVNKSDLGTEETMGLIKIYEQLDLQVTITNTKQEDGLSALVNELQNPELSNIVLLGVSGVGKSSILNRLVPEAAQLTNEVSAKTGQGRQTTSISTGYVYERSAMVDLLVIDLPGIQHFGLTDFSKYDVRFGFSEFMEVSGKCEYSDCLHLEEPNCAVKEALRERIISLERYESYLNIIAEIEESQSY